MLAKLRTKLTYANVVSTLCLFLVAGSGTAVALSGHNTVFSDDIVNDEVKGSDVDEGSLDQLKVSVPIEDYGPLPLTGTFRSQGGKILLLASGSSFRESNPGLTAMQVFVDGDFVDTIFMYANEVSVHEGFPTAMNVIDLPAGKHRIRLKAGNFAACPNPPVSAACTTTDTNDHFHASVIELP